MRESPTWLSVPSDQNNATFARKPRTNSRVLLELSVHYTGATVDCDRFKVL
ncbi:hypothetical protein RvY_08452 [Ramazzottius varieornatus]|uniref:Uncharacterized protein n=1 Tax=Ramazzottius varieornatus TaxID=947166 RepID=A0A1D1V5U5_RAMVA|nr:hypothetical protein RvY_08452 [Ramazzottius varieornatus]